MHTVTVSLFDAKTHLSRIVNDLAAKKDDEVIISRRGKPVVRLVPIRPKDVSKRIGIAKGQFLVPDDIDSANPEIERLFAAEGRGVYETAR